MTRPYYDFSFAEYEGADFSIMRPSMLIHEKGDIKKDFMKAAQEWKSDCVIVQGFPDPSYWEDEVVLEILDDEIKERQVLTTPRGNLPYIFGVINNFSEELEETYSERITRILRLSRSMGVYLIAFRENDSPISPHSGLLQIVGFSEEG